MITMKKTRMTMTATATTASLEEGDEVKKGGTENVTYTDPPGPHPPPPPPPPPPPLRCLTPEEVAQDTDGDPTTTEEEE